MQHIESIKSIEKGAWGTYRHTAPRWGWALAVCVCMGGAGLLGLKHLHVFLPSPDLLRTIVEQNSATKTEVFYDRHGRAVRLPNRRYGFEPDYVTLGSMPGFLVQAFLCAEDMDFFSHRGFSLESMARAWWVNLKAGGIKQGASTITQQLARQLFLNREKRYARKIKEILIAIQLEQLFPKSLLMEVYLNRVFLGNHAYGVAEASRRYFHKPLHDITLAEAALLAGLPKAPSRFAPHRFPERAIHRRNEVLQQMAAQGLITQEQAANSIKSPLFQASLFQVSLAPQEFNSPAIDPLMAYGFWSTYARQFKGESSLGMRLSSVHLSMDAYLQEQLQQTLANLVTSMPPSEPSVPVPSAIWQGAGVILDGYSGDLLALQGSRSFTESPFNRAMYMKRAMGSLILPFIYAAALQAGYPWDAHMEDAFVHLRPEHAVGILESVGLDYTLDFLKTLGLRPSEDLDLVLGFQVMTPNELAKAFARLWFPESRRYLHPFAPYTLFQDLPLQPWGSVPHTHPLLHERTNFQVRYGLNTHVRQVYEPTSQVSGMSGQDIHKKNCWFVGTLDSHLLLLWTGTDHEQATLPNALCGRALAIAGLSLLGGARSPTEK